jgi:uncharacterized protein
MNELINLAKDSIKEIFKGKLSISDTLKKKHSENCGVFVTLTKKGELRGCIGYIESEKPIWQSIIECAKFAAFDDPRFPRLTKEEFDLIEIEISILSKPKLVLEKNPNKLINYIVIGRDGLIIKKGYKSGLLLPQVATEYNWNAEEFLNHTCIKAGISIKTWRESKDYELYTFEVKIIKEKNIV